MAATVSRSSSRNRSRVAKSPSRQGKNSKPGSEAATGDVAGVLAELLALEGDGWVVSCYQKLEPSDRDNGKYRIKLKNRLRLVADRLDVMGFPHADRETVKEYLDRIEQFFAHSQNLD